VALTPIQKLRIRARSGVAEETLNAYLADRSRVRSVSASRIEEAARAEGLALPCSSSQPPPEAA
jgi:hypothetical protein